MNEDKPDKAILRIGQFQFELEHTLTHFVVREENPYAEFIYEIKDWKTAGDLWKVLNASSVGHRDEQIT